MREYGTGRRQRWPRDRATLGLDDAGPGHRRACRDVDNDGIVNIPGATGTGFFTVATSIVGAGGNITASADTGAVSLPLTLSICQTKTATGVCLSPAAGSVTTQFKDAENVTRGATSMVSAHAVICEWLDTPSIQKSIRQAIDDTLGQRGRP